MFDLKVIAGQYLALTVTQVHGTALAVSPYLAVAALVFLHPLAVAVEFETVLPQIPEIICMDIALIVQW